MCARRNFGAKNHLVRRVAIDSSVAHWGRWAQREGTHYRELKRRNPWLREAYFENPDSVAIELELPVLR